jgi:catechol 2,3-dioxygenase-like lactoylglutathione lyase family enzyme
MTTMRREFIKQAGATSLFLAAHEALCSGEPLAKETNPGEAGARILRLELATSVALGRMRDFYQGILGMRVVEDQPGRLTMAAGETLLTFVAAEAAAGQPFYHFAFNIPENKAGAAWKWQKERTSLLPIPMRLRDSAYPPEVVNYAHWNAHSVFFFDPAENVVEYIARHDLQNGSPGDFGPSDILYASEIAFVTDDVLSLAKQITNVSGAKPYRKGGDENFMALGDDQGLLLVMKRGRVISFDAPVKKAVEVFPTKATWRGAEAAVHRLGGQAFELTIAGGR